MRVLLTTDTVGGVWTFTRELVAELLRRDHEVALFSLGQEPSREQSAWCSGVQAEYSGAFRYEASPVPLEWMLANDIAYSSAEHRLLDMAEQFDPDVFHSNQFCFGCLPIGCPHLITAHSDVLTWADACRPGGLEPSAWLTNYVGLVSNGLNGADAVSAPTQWMLDALRRHFAVGCYTTIIANGRSMPPATLREDRKLQAVSAGRLWDEAKNIAFLRDIEAPFPVFVAGDASYEAAVMPDHFGPATLLGPLSEGELLSLFRNSSMYIVTSVYEPFGLAPLEAAMCGCAVLANDIPSLREVWGDAALYFSNAASLTALLRALTLSPELLHAARCKSQAHAEQYTAKRMTEGYLALYSDLIGARSSAPMSRELVANVS